MRTFADDVRVGRPIIEAWQAEAEMRTPEGKLKNQVKAFLKERGAYFFMPVPTGYGTPTGGSHQASFAAGSITLANLAAAVAQLIVDMKANGYLGA